MATKKPARTREDAIETLNRQVTEMAERHADVMGSGPEGFAMGYILGSAFHSSTTYDRDVWFSVLQKRTGLDDEFIATELIGG